MKKLLALLLFVSVSAWAAYSPGVFIADPTTPANQAKVTASTPAGTDKAVACILHPNSASIGVTGTFWQATQPVSAASLPLPTGASTSALQTTANTSLATIATNSGKIPPNSTAAFSQTSVTTTASTVSAPANAVRVLIQGDSSNTDCIRYRFDGTAATATVGVVAQPGQDSGQLDSGMSVSVAACSGTQKVNVQYLAQ